MWATCTQIIYLSCIILKQHFDLERCVLVFCNCLGCQALYARGKLLRSKDEVLCTQKIFYFACDYSLLHNLQKT